MGSKPKKRSKVRSFEREARIQRLIEAGIIQSADEIPADAIPASIEYITRTRSSYRLHNRKPYYRDIEYRCEGCGKEGCWTADEQRYWYEQLHGSAYSTVTRCADCRRARRGVR